MATSDELDPPVLGLNVLRGHGGWCTAIKQLEDQWTARGDTARAHANQIRERYTSRRGTMVLDVVLSRQRRYDARVLPLLERWETEIAAKGESPSLRALLTHPVSRPDFPLRDGEWETIADVTRGLLRYARERDLSEERACRDWAISTKGLELASKLDPYVGIVKGIGPALLAYLRILCGADTIKPDVRVLRELQQLGMSVPTGDAATGFVVACCVAHELGVGVIELDQLLWYARE